MARIAQGWGLFGMRKTRGRFFSSLSGVLKNEFAGRFLSLQLAEFGRHDPVGFFDVFADLFPGFVGVEDKRRILSGDAEFVVEEPHVAGRRADVSVLVRGEPILVFEVKVKDVHQARNDAQLDDYIKFVRARKGRTKLVHLSRYHSARAEAQLARLVGADLAVDLSFSDLLSAIYRSGQKRIQSQISLMIQEYLEDSGVDAYRHMILSEEAAALKFLLVQTGALRHQHGWGKTQSLSTARRSAELLALLVGNMSAFADWFCENNGHFSRPQTRFRVFSAYDRDELAKDLGKSKERLIYPSGAHDASIHFEARCSIGSEGRWASLAFGRALSYDKSTKKARTYPYAYTEWNGAEIEHFDGDYHRKYPTESEAMAELKELLRDARNHAVKAAPPPLRKAFKQIVVPS